MRLGRFAKSLAGLGLVGLVMLVIAAAGLVVRVGWMPAGLASTGDPPVSVIDGDTIQVDGKIVQLYGIDAPELGQMCRHDQTWFHCGLDAAFDLNKLIGLEASALHCAPPDSGPSDDTMVCTVGHVDVAHVLLSSGYVVATAAAGAHYLEAEHAARDAQLGLWHSDFVPPADWRAGERLPGGPAPEAGPCPIKAVVSPGGQHDYYVPTDKNYDSVAVDPSKGDRRFCSDEDARKAGWIRPGQSLPTSG